MAVGAVQRGLRRGQRPHAQGSHPASFSVFSIALGQGAPGSVLPSAGPPHETALFFAGRQHAADGSGLSKRHHVHGLANARREPAVTAPSASAGPRRPAKDTCTPIRNRGRRCNASCGLYGSGRHGAGTVRRPPRRRGGGERTPPQCIPSTSQAAARLEAAILAEQEELVDAACLSDGHGRTRPGRLPCDRQRSAIKALYALPEAFPTAIHISDFRAADIFALSTALGASSEEAAVQGLHRWREERNPTGPYALDRFERQAQTRPAVRLITEAPEEEAALRGIELKGWFSPSKEGAPTFRYTVRAVCVRAGRFASRLSPAPERCGSGQSARATPLRGIRAPSRRTAPLLPARDARSKQSQRPRHPCVASKSLSVRQNRPGLGPDRRRARP